MFGNILSKILRKNRIKNEAWFLQGSIADTAYFSLLGPYSSRGAAEEVAADIPITEVCWEPVLEPVIR